eukprot:CAMPEP_0178414038 /NCGR_PEP_ID=MMETSP0689_2-20121128/22832_1 /TAXON_ID=160604 /ORGANISM="Amphidinium massartii, Strain CS-259" /LENGTH=179 /DNA_ID=CAMNT_0020035319 /DNA_START=40 /DNA_END=580 /DNA_ORIENTATION=+
MLLTQMLDRSEKVDADATVAVFMPGASPLDGSNAEDPSQADRKVVVTQDEITVVDPNSPEGRAELYAERVRCTLSSSLGDDDMQAITAEVQQVGLSKERVKTVIERTNEKQLTCAQLQDLLKLLSLEAHRKQVIFLRYPHLVDRQAFNETILQQFTKSEALKKIVWRELVDHLCSQASN